MVLYKDPIGLYALLLLIPFILLYLFSLRPEKKIFSSIMFFIKSKSTTKNYSFFKKLLTNLLLLLQLLVILFLAYSSASPQVEFAQNTTDEHSVIILDTSASMQSGMGMSSRFEQSISEAKSLISNKQKVSIILAEDIPLIVLEKEDVEEATAVLDNLQPSEAKSNVEDALIQAMTIMDKGTVYVFSDYAFSQSLIAAKKQLNMKGISVVFKTFNEPASNVGFIDYSIYENEIKIKVKNFNEKSYKVKISSEYESKTLELLPNSVGEETFTLKSGKTTFTLEANDDFQPDNYLYIIVPEREKIKTLYLTNNFGKDYFKTALRSLDRLDITEANLPVVPEGDYELYIVKDIDKSKLLPATFGDFYRAAEDGARVIVNLQSDSSSIDYKSLGLLNLDSLKGRSILIKNIKNEVTSDVEFGDVNKYFSSSDYDCENWVMSKEQDPLICYKEVDEGSILINGIIEAESDFKNTPDYPIFWSSVLDYIFPEEQKEDVIFNTGTIMPISFQEIKTPTGTINTNKIILNRAGFYSYDNKTIAANLLDYDESNINQKQDIESELGSLIGKASTESEQTDVARYLIFFALLLVFIELFVIKWRGDL